MERHSLFFTIVTIKPECFQLGTPKFLDTFGLIIEQQLSNIKHGCGIRKTQRMGIDICPPPPPPPVYMAFFVYISAVARVIYLDLRELYTIETKMQSSVFKHSCNWRNRNKNKKC